VPLFKKILVPLDGSDHSLRALETAVEVAKKFESNITLVHVYSLSIPPLMMPESTTMGPPGIPVGAPAEISRLVDAEREAGNRILADGKERAAAKGLDVECLLKEGSTVQEIAKTANEGGFDLIVMGARGISRIREILVGSVSDGVTKHASCPVLVVK